MRECLDIDPSRIWIQRRLRPGRRASGQESVWVSADFDRLTVVERPAAALIAPLEITTQLHMEVGRETVLDERPQDATVDLILPRPDARISVERKNRIVEQRAAVRIDDARNLMRPEGERGAVPRLHGR